MKKGERGRKGERGEGSRKRGAENKDNGCGGRGDSQQKADDEPAARGPSEAHYPYLFLFGV